MSSAQWFMALSGRQVGPMPEQEVIANIENGTADGNTLVFTAGMRLVQADSKLAAIVGSQPLPRSELTKKLWNYIKRHDFLSLSNRTCAARQPSRTRKSREKKRSSRHRAHQPLR